MEESCLKDSGAARQGQGSLAIAMTGSGFGGLSGGGGCWCAGSATPHRVLTQRFASNEYMVFVVPLS